MKDSKKEYLTPNVDILPTLDILTLSQGIPEIGEDDNELPKQDW